MIYLKIKNNFIAQFVQSPQIEAAQWKALIHLLKVSITTKEDNSTKFVNPYEPPSSPPSSIFELSSSNTMSAPSLLYLKTLSLSSTQASWTVLNFQKPWIHAFGILKLLQGGRKVNRE
ncbi:937_t:CDS:2 [Funneliformis caledonium]|uniref:937_t:CDS:1 n=1 Tax=Funneliformis caledonium TaxID=1117310 RepID=A0A9N9DSV2_9GLOM|nr:937_t:CDS:2 [Funneliformis caledonium]